MQSVRQYQWETPSHISADWRTQSSQAGKEFRIGRCSVDVSGLPPTDPGIDYSQKGDSERRHPNVKTKPKYFSSMLKKIKDTVKRVNSNKRTSFCAGHTQREKQFRRWQSKEAVSRVSRKKKKFWTALLKESKMYSDDKGWPHGCQKNNDQWDTAILTRAQSELKQNSGLEMGTSSKN